MQQLRQSRSILIQMLLATVTVVTLAIYFSDVLSMIYASNQQTSTGYLLNGMIFVLFLLGIGRTVLLLIGYNREERDFAAVQRNLDHGQGGLLQGVSPASLIALRVEMLENMRIQRVPINHQALAAGLLATESTRTGLIRFIHNILILCGVLGTIVSLSIALFGASSLLEEAVSSSGMGMVIHGMSTALSTTMTAIVCYLFLSYFLSAIQNLQTHLLGRLETLTTTRLLPLYQVTEEAMNQHAVDLVREAHLLVESLREKVDALNPDTLFSEFEHYRAEMRAQHEEAMAQQRALAGLLKDGFRLPGE